jgi:hypothetical protein
MAGALAAVDAAKHAAALVDGHAVTTTCRHGGEGGRGEWNDSAVTNMIRSLRVRAIVIWCMDMPSRHLQQAEQ